MAAMALLWMLLTVIGGITWANASGLATVYLPIGAAVGLMHRFPRHITPFAIGIVVGAVLLVPLTDDVVLNGLLGGTANAIEAVVAAVLLRVLGVRFDRSADALNFLVATATGALAGALLGAISVTISGTRPPLEAATTWFAADLLGMVVVTPSVYLTTRASLQIRRALSSLTLLVFTTYCTVLLAQSVATSSDFWTFALWMPLLFIVLLVGMRFGVTVLGYVQIPAVVALFATIPKAHYSLWYQRQGLTIVLIIAMMWGVLQVSELLVRLEANAGIAGRLLEASPLACAVVRNAGSDYVVQNLNAPLLAALGTGSERAHGVPLLTLLHPDDAAAALRSLRDGQPSTVRPAARTGSARRLLMQVQWVTVGHGPVRRNRAVVTFTPEA